MLSLRLERVWYGMKRLWRNYSLSITLAGLFLVSWIGQLVTQWFTWANEQQEHSQPLEVGDFLWQFWTSTLENWQSEFLTPLLLIGTGRLPRMRRGRSGEFYRRELAPRLS